MVNINLHEFKANLSAYARRVRAGETIIVCERNKPFAELRPLATRLPPRPPPGLFRDEIEIGENFFAVDDALAAEFVATPLPPPASARPRTARR